ncbi:MAG: elongation factor G [Acidimicrobiia bacterium]
MSPEASDRIRNVALVGHGGSGKTTLTEAALFEAGAVPRAGTVEDGTTVCDFDPEEVRRGLSVSLAVAPLLYDGHRINLIDTPGYADFIGDVTAALRVADLAVFVVSAVEGVEVGTETAWRLAEERDLPRAVFVTKLDRERASFDRTLAELKEKFGAGVAPLELPIGVEADFRGVIDLLDDSARTYVDGTATVGPVPDDMAVTEHEIHEALIEGIVVGDDDLTERYLADEKLDLGEIVHALADGIAAADVFPVLCGSGTTHIGIDRLLRFIVDEGPPPTVHDGGTAAFVFKTIADPYVGRVNLFKVLAGSVRSDDHLTNDRTGADLRLHQITTICGKEQEPTPEVGAGDIGAVAKLTDTATGDLLRASGATVTVDPLESPPPVLATAVRAATKADDDKLATALHRLEDEDPSLTVERNDRTHQVVLRGMGETHLSLTMSRLRDKYGVDATEEPVAVEYLETVTTSAEAEGKHKKQSGGHGQFGVAVIKLEPAPPGTGLEFVDAVVGGAIPRPFIPAVEKGIREAMERGGLHGFPVVDVKVTLFDGKHHSVDSNEASFKMAGSLAFRNALESARPVVLEPVSELVVMVPEEFQGDVMGDLNAKRGRIQGSASLGRGEAEIVAHVPTAEILRYAIDLRSMTHGRGRFHAEHDSYEQVPAHIADSLGG